MRIRPQRGELAPERHDLRESGSAVRVGEVTALGGIHDVAAAPEVVKGIVHADLADAVLIGEADGFLHRGEGRGLAKLEIGIPNFGSSKFAGDFLDHGTRHAAAGLASEMLVEVQRLDAIVGPDAMGAGHFAEAGRVRCLLHRKAAVLIGGRNEIAVERVRDNVESGG